MADNVTLNPGSGGSVIATDDISGLQYQRCKLIFGKDGVNDGDVSRLNAFPVSLFPGDNAGIDAFGRLRVSEPHTLFDSKLVETNGSLFWDTALTGSGTATWLNNEAAYELALTTASGDKVIRQTKEYFGYQPGKSQLVFITGVMGSIKSDVRQRIGYFDTNNGLFWEQDGTNFKIVRRSKTSGIVVDTSVNQTSWNLDTMDGNGPSVSI